MIPSRSAPVSRTPSSVSGPLIRTSELKVVKSPLKVALPLKTAGPEKAEAPKIATPSSLTLTLRIPPTWNLRVPG